ncbi:MAG: radical SAM protein [Deltaproteobacteria bacterium]|nr:radical SAM protein [Deltaproteobacteria bacterium]
MDFMVLAPPVVTPAEPPSGAFVLAAGLAGHGAETGLLDLSLELFHRLLEQPDPPGINTAAQVEYLIESTAGYTPERHRSAVGEIHRKLGLFTEAHPGWKLTLMDVTPPVRVHDPAGLAELLARESPFTELWNEVLVPALDRHRPRRVVVSLAYLSQLPATIDLVRFLRSRNIDPLVGGSLPRSLASTGHGIEALSRVLPQLDTGDGLSLVSESPGGHLTDRLGWPSLLSSRPYLSSRPIIPLTMSTGCFWRRCRFCPDRELEFVRVPLNSLDDLLASTPSALATRRPVIHLLDSALPPAQLRRFLPLAKQHQLGFYGFARPSAELAAGDLLEDAADAGCLMLQLGAESGSPDLLERYDKGFSPGEAEQVIRATAAAGIRNYLYLLFGLPAESPADREATRSLVDRNREAIDFLNVSLFNLPRFCELSRRASKECIEIGDFPDDRELIRLYWPFTVAGESPRALARAFLKQSFDVDPAVRAARLRTPRWLRAAHLALMKLDRRRGP